MPLDPALSRRSLLCTVALLLTLVTTSCNGGFPGGGFFVIRTDPGNRDVAFLNDSVDIDFSRRVDLASVDLSSVAFEVFDLQGNQLTEAVVGTFRLGPILGPLSWGRRLSFDPLLPTNNTYDNGGFRAARRYRVRLAGGPASTIPLRSIAGQPLAQPFTFEFTTPVGSTPGELFRNPEPGGPRRTGLAVTTASDLQNVPLGLFGDPPLEVRLDFDQALNPDDGNVPVNFDTDPLVRDIADRGRIYLEYDDPVFGPATWIPTDVRLARNGFDGATVVLRPAGVLPNNAEVRVIVEETLEDISGESNVVNPAYDRVFGTFRTTPSYEQQWNGIVEEFASADAIDMAAAFLEVPAEVGPGYVRAGFDFGGAVTGLDYQPTSTEVVLNTAFTQITPSNGLPFTVSGGVFNFRDVTIPAGVTVRGVGPNPMVWLCSGTFTVAGTLSVRGGDGTRVDTLQSANFPKAGGIGVCGGGSGGDGTPSATERDVRGGTGRGPLQQAGGGGGGGFLACVAGCYTGSGYNGSGGGSGGGGGTMATQGDLNWRGVIPPAISPNTPPTANTAFQQVFGYGGSGCSGNSGTRTSFLPGGEPGPRVFTDARVDNDFWGTAIDVNRSLRITGELSVPVGGGGGGGGGDTSPANDCSLTGSNPASDYSGGGGGGGGGVLIVKALQQIVIASTGHIVADGGNGGGGEQAGASGEAGGGGGAAGGMVILMSAEGIVIEAHGDPSVGANGRYVYGSPAATATVTHPFLGDDYDFAISADGGVCTTGSFGSVNVQGKYPANGQTMLSGAVYDREPLGGLGGMGIVQLMAPPGNNLFDATNTRLDDNVHFRIGSQSAYLTGDEKRQLLAWRGFPDQFGVHVDDFGNPTNIGNNEGDIRPAPVLMPATFGAKSRARSKWIDTGRSQRRAVPAPDGLPRGIVVGNGATVGPVYEFAGLALNGGLSQGYIDYDVVGQSTRIRYPVAVQPAALQLVDPNASHRGEPALRIVLNAPNAALAETNRYVQYQAELLDATNTPLAEFRILSHDQQELLVDPGSTVVPAGASKVQVRAKFFEVVTQGVEGLGPTYGGQVGMPVPRANLRIGFAFHQDPDPSNLLAGRYPTSSLDDFVHDLDDPGLQAWIAANGEPRYVMWDVLFDMRYQPGPAGAPPLTPDAPRPSLQFLRLPFRF